MTYSEARDCMRVLTKIYNEPVVIIGTHTHGASRVKVVRNPDNTILVALCSSGNQYFLNIEEQEIEWLFRTVNLNWTLHFRGLSFSEIEAAKSIKHFVPREHGIFDKNKIFHPTPLHECHGKEPMILVEVKDQIPYFVIKCQECGHHARVPLDDNDILTKWNA